ncbi:IS3 family transposase, partial [Pseudonocardia xishanensis]|uniref:IS3 family transposase n=1 Tax=Pseudonocardia xishanensis TaxID=630995 RepID=UPI0031E8B81D
VEAGRPVVDVAGDLGVGAQSIYTRRRQDRIGKGLRPGLSSGEKSELTAAKSRIAERETELAIHRRGTELLGKVVPPARRYEAIAVMAGEGLPVQPATRVPGVAESGYCAALTRPVSARAIRHAWLVDQIREVHHASNGTYGVRRVHAEFVLGRGVTVGHDAVEMLMARNGVRGVTGRARWKRHRADLIARDLVDSG